ncbi:MAG: DUF3806 domain-containing protein [Hyphomicrobiaceae bacterium]
MRIFPLEDSDRLALAQQLSAAEHIISIKLPGRVLTGNATDLPILQELLDRGALRWDVPSEIEPIELAVGRLLIVLEAKIKSPDALPLQWCIVVDEYGRRLAIKHRDYDAVVNPLDVLTKRLEKGRTVKLSALIADLVGAVLDQVEAGTARESTGAADDGR